MKTFMLKEPFEQSPRVPKVDKCRRIILLLDESGSMSSQRDDIIGGINEMIRQQKKIDPDDTYFDIIKFNDCVKPIRSQKLADIHSLTDSDYTPSGSTALFDAIGQTISRYRNENNVIFIIATDGQENSSRQYSYKEITRLIGEQRDHHDWDLIYLSEDIDTFQQGDRLGINNNIAKCYNQNVGKTQLGMCFQQESFNAPLYSLRMGKKADFSELSGVPSSPKYSSSHPSPKYSSSHPLPKYGFTPRRNMW